LRAATKQKKKNEETPAIFKKMAGVFVLFGVFFALLGDISLFFQVLCFAMCE
jgi:hypothetical protein